MAAIVANQFTMMKDDITSDESLSDSSSSSSVADSECKADDILSDLGDDTNVPPTTSELPHLPEPKPLISMHTNVQMGIVQSLDNRDQYLVNLAEVKKSIARAERKLAHHRTKERMLLYRLQRVQEELAKKRMRQAEINFERTSYYQKRRHEKPMLAGSPVEILATLSRPSPCLPRDIGVA